MSTALTHSDHSHAWVEQVLGAMYMSLIMLQQLYDDVLWDADFIGIVFTEHRARGSVLESG